MGPEDDPNEKVGGVAVPGGLIFKKELPNAPTAGVGEAAPAALAKGFDSTVVDAAVLANDTGGVPPAALPPPSAEVDPNVDDCPNVVVCPPEKALDAKGDAAAAANGLFA